MEGYKEKRVKGPGLMQKRKLVELMGAHPELISFKFSPDFTHTNYVKIWMHIARECNAIPGAKKTWKQWRKTWQDLRNYTKKKIHVDVKDKESAPVIKQLSMEERKALGLDVKNDQQDEDEQFSIQRNTESYNNSEEGPVKLRDMNKSERRSTRNDHDVSACNCGLNYELLTRHEQKKLNLKQEYMDFKKQYLSQKLKLLKEQTEALNAIARALNDKK